MDAKFIIFAYYVLPYSVFSSFLFAYSLINNFRDSIVMAFIFSAILLFYQYLFNLSWDFLYYAIFGVFYIFIASIFVFIVSFIIKSFLPREIPRKHTGSSSCLKFEAANGTWKDYLKVFSIFFFIILLGFVFVYFLYFVRLDYLTLDDIIFAYIPSSLMISSIGSFLVTLPIFCRLSKCVYYFLILSFLIGVYIGISNYYYSSVSFVFSLFGSIFMGFLAFIGFLIVFGAGVLFRRFFNKRCSLA